MKRLLRGPVISLASQGIGLVQLGIILFLLGASNATDTYFYLFSLGLVPILILLVGLMYPMMLNEHRISKVGLNRLRWVVPAMSVLFVLGGSGWLVLQDRMSMPLVPLAIALLLNAAIQTSVWYRAVAAEAEGEPLWISGVALPSNALGSVLLLPPWPSDAVAMTAMALGLIVGNLALLGVMAAKNVGYAALAAAPNETLGRRGSYWFVGKASVGYASQVIMQSVAVTLPAASVTLLNIANKVVGSVSASFVNALMPHFVHQRSESPDAGRRFLRTILPIIAFLDVVAVFGVAIWRPDLVTAAVTVAIWVMASTSAAVAQRMAFKFLPSNASRIGILVIVVIVALVLISARSPMFGLTVLLAALAVMDAITAMLLLWLLRDRIVSSIMAIAAGSVAIIWVNALFPA